MSAHHLSIRFSDGLSSEERRQDAEIDRENISANVRTSGLSTARAYSVRIFWSNCQVPKITRGLLSRSNDREWAAEPQASPQAPSSAPSMWEDQSSSSLAPGSQPTVEITNETTRIMVPRPGRPVERCNVHYPPRTVHPLPGGACQYGATPAPADWRRTVFPYQDGGGGYWREVIWISYPSRPWVAARRCVCWWWQTADGRWHRAGDYLW